MQDEPYGRQSILSTYIQYQCKIPHPLKSRTEMTLSESRDELKSNSNPDLYLSSDLLHKGVDRSVSMKAGKFIIIFKDG